MINFIVNPYAGNGKTYSIWKGLEKYLQKKRVHYEGFITKARGEARELAASLSDSKDYVSIVIVGGDGTVNEVLDGLVISDKLSVAYIPTGTCKDLAKGLKLPLNPMRCLKRILAAKEVRSIDYGVVNFGKGEHRRFLVSAGIGMDAELCSNFSNIELKTGFNLSNSLKRFMCKCKTLCSAIKSRGYVIVDSTKKIEFNHIVLVSSHIHPYEAGGFMLAPKALNSDGELGVCIVHPKSRFRLLRIILSSCLGNHLKYAGVRSLDCCELKIHLENAFPLHTDGEYCGRYTDIEIRCVKQKLRFVI